MTLSIVCLLLHVVERRIAESTCPPDGTLLAKFVLNERVTALAWDEWIAARQGLSGQAIHQLYMTVGHRIAPLHTIAGPEPLATRRPGQRPLSRTRPMR